MVHAWTRVLDSGVYASRRHPVQRYVSCVAVYNRCMPLYGPCIDSDKRIWEKVIMAHTEDRRSTQMKVAASSESLSAR